MQEKIRMTLLMKFIGYTYTFWSEFEYTRHGNYNLFPRFAHDVDSIAGTLSTVEGIKMLKSSSIAKAK